AVTGTALAKISTTPGMITITLLTLEVLSIYISLSDDFHVERPPKVWELKRRPKAWIHVKSRAWHVGLWPMNRPLIWRGIAVDATNFRLVVVRGAGWAF
ncbi:hypothetical protein Tco_0048810, partial [Tanacetum coccineum]